MTAPTPTPAAPGGATAAELPPRDPRDASTGELIGQLTEQLSRLVRDEARLAQVEVSPSLPAPAIAGAQADLATVKQGLSR